MSQCYKNLSADCVEKIESIIERCQPDFDAIRFELSDVPEFLDSNTYKDVLEYLDYYRNNKLNEDDSTGNFSDEPNPFINKKPAKQELSLDEDEKEVLQKNLEISYKKEVMPIFMSENSKQLQGIKFRREKRELLAKATLEVRKSFILKNQGVPEWFVDQVMDRWSDENLKEKTSSVVFKEKLNFNVDLQSASIPKYQWVVKSLGLCAGLVNFLAGKMEKGKTMLAQNLAVCVATGIPFLGKYPVEQGGVVHLDFDRNGRTNTYIRYLRIAKALNVKPDCIDFATLQYKMDSLEFDEQGNGVRDHLIELMTGNKLIIIDSLSAGTENDENDAAIRKPLDMVSDISEKTGCMALVIAHSGHDDNNHLIRGSSAIGQAGAQIFGVRSKDGSNIYNVSLEKGRIDREIDSFSYQMVDEGNKVEQWGKREELHFIFNGAAEEGQTGLSPEEKILIALEGTSKDKPMKNKGEHGLEETVGIKATLFDAGRKKLVEEGKIFQTTVGKSTAVYYHL